ncbi:RNA polymerase sigma-70 factor, ECF subfamily [Agrococcus jejuensis]|uniref:RNA polymerase sigma-70 factor, ECF subfamily n=2 Tax=Agrococcus jejuensis TaxID=399736 RepID=A0A1G8G2G3_9MICO|nr:RNA polymerase sigma-70 factor, ECF subfamily [Agrococcus jejuensis]
MTIAMPRRTVGWGRMHERPADAAPAVAAASFDAQEAFAAHGGALLGFAVNALQDRPLAEDCVQETFLRAWRARATFDGERGSERTWLFAIARRVVIDAHRARARRPRLVPQDEHPEPIAHVADPLERLGMVEALARLSAPQREAIVAIHLHGVSYAEHSAATGVPAATLRTRVFSALRALRGILDEVDTNDA